MTDSIFFLIFGKRYVLWRLKIDRQMEIIHLRYKIELTKVREIGVDNKIRDMKKRFETGNLTKNEREREKGALEQLEGLKSKLRLDLDAMWQNIDDLKEQVDFMGTHAAKVLNPERPPKIEKAQEAAENQQS